MTDNQNIGFGGGCHWCTEAVFQSLNGVLKVEQGFIKSSPPNDSYSEAVMIEFTSDKIPLSALIEVHLRTHSSMSNHKMRGKYRSAIYSVSEDQRDNAQIIVNSLQSEFEAPIVTLVLPFLKFKYSDKRFHNYYENNSDGPFCKRYIDPKLDMLKQQYKVLLKRD